MREVGDSDASSERDSGGDSDEAGSGAELEDFERGTMRVQGRESGAQRASARVTAVVVEESEERGGGWPELEGETLRRKLPDEDG